LYPLVAALIVIPIVNGVLNVAQTYLTEVVGNRVLQELRNRLFAHLEQLSLAFYTATRSGEVQSRLANDVGGVQTTITSTASSVVSNVVTLVSSVVAMLLLSPLLTAISLAATPVFVLFSRRVGRARRVARRDAQASLASMGSITQETLSVSGILLAKVFGRQAHEIERYRAENANQAALQIRQAFVGRSFFAVTQAFFGISPALVYDELLAQGGVYARLYEEQFGDGVVEAHCSDGVILANGHPCRPSSQRTPARVGVPAAEAADQAEPAAELPAELRTVLTT
jgi:ATP-binding cassette subfamily B protein